MEFARAVWEVLEGEAARAGVSVSEFVCDAALARVAFARRTRADGLDDLLAGWAAALVAEDAPRAELDVSRQRLFGKLLRAEARNRRGEAAALHAETTQAIRQAHALGSRRGLLLEAAAAWVAEVIERRGFALAAPVAAGFRVSEDGSTGIEVSIRLRDRHQAPAARAAIVECLGGESSVDMIDVR